MLIGYARNTRTDVEHLRDIQREALIGAGVAPENIHEEFTRSRRKVPSELEELLNLLRPGDTLVVWRLSRLCRDARHAISIYDDLALRGIALEVLTGAGLAISASQNTISSVSQVFFALTELDREVSEERAHLQALSRPKYKAPWWPPL